MNATSAEAAVPRAITPPAEPQRAPAAAGRAWTRTAPQHLPVWDERARKMGFPPSSR
ncbi:MAG TPA: hypothetical protein VFK10_09680 [Burkholderiaceae bacterium]|nr:hypothetical protein [Burkholderiaceae bacterium]